MSLNLIEVSVRKVVGKIELIKIRMFVSTNMT